MESELILSGGGLPPLSARGCIQRLMPIEAGMLRRTVNGTLIYTGKPLTRKYRSIISCEDKASLALDGLWRGSEVRIGCIQQLWQRITDQEILLERDPVEGSVFAITTMREEVVVQAVTGRKVEIAEGGLGSAFISYRPWLNMRVITFSLMTNEWGLKTGWQLELEEI